MKQADSDYLEAAARRIEQLLAGQTADSIRPGGLSPELVGFAERFEQLMEAMSALRRFAIAIGNGDISYEAPSKIHLLDPLKQLQANLLHLIWQTQQIASGDLEQQVHFLGEFSNSFNYMIEKLREKRAVEEKVRYLGFHDALTGLYNRTYFNEEIERLRVSRNYPVTFLIADLDDLKVANDTHGHEVGDLLIQRSARLLANCVRAQDVVARLGGDEFVIILQGADQAEARAVISRIVDSISVQNSRDESLFPISFSLGAGTAKDSKSLEQALRQADQSMYRQKFQRRGNVGRRPIAVNQDYG